MLRYKTFRKLFTPADTTPLLRLCENRDLRIDKVKTAFGDGTDDQLLLSTILKRLLVKHVHIAAISTPLRPESWRVNTLVVRWGTGGVRLVVATTTYAMLASKQQ